MHDRGRFPVIESGLQLVGETPRGCRGTTGGPGKGIIPKNGRNSLLGFLIAQSGTGGG